MRPPITATNTKNDGATGIQTTLHRKQQKINQKDIFVENQNFQSNTFKPNYSQQLFELEQQQKIIKNQPIQTNDINLSSSFSIINENSSNHQTNFVKTNNDIKLLNKNLVTTSNIDAPVPTTINLNSNLNSNSTNLCINNKNLIVNNQKQFNSDISDLKLTSLSNINEKQFNFELNDDNIEHEHSNDIKINENFNRNCDLEKIKKSKNFNTNYIDERNNLHLINSRKNKLINNIQLSDATATTTATAKALDYNLDLNDTNNSICLNKNSASLIFTKKDIPTTTATTTTTTTKINENKKKLNNTNNSNNKKINYNHHSISIGANNKILNKNNSNLIASQIPASYSSSSTSSSSLSTSTSSLKYTNNDNDLINFDENNLTNNYHRNSLQLNYINLNDNQEYNFNNNSNNINLRTTTATANRKQLAYSWYAPIYSALEEEIEQDSKDSTPTHNLANLKKTNSAKIPSQQHQKQQQFYISSTKSLDENEKLLENRPQPNIQPQLHHQPRLRRQQLVINQHEHNNNISKNPSHLTLSPVVQQSQNDYEGPQSASLLAGGPLPRRRRFENFLKSLVGRKTSKDSNSSAAPGSQLNNTTPQLPSPEITVTHSPSENSLLRDFNSRLSINGNPTGESYYDKITNSTLSLNTVQQKLWNVVPLLRRENSALSLHNEKSNSIVQYTGLRKCETVLALSRQSGGSGYIGSVTTVNNNIPNTCSMPVNIKRNSYGISIQPNSVGPIKPQNRLRNSLSTTNATCSRCSSLLSLAASGSKYSLNNGYISINNNSNINNSNNNNFINANSSKLNKPTESISDIRKSLSSSFQYNNNDDNIITSNDCIDGNLSINDVDDDNNSGNISPPLSSTDESTTLTLNSAVTQLQQPQAELFKIFSCKLCLSDVINFNDATTIIQCGCKFCTECIKSYIEFEITEGAYDISCPDAQCPVQGIISLTEISGLVSNQLIQKYHRYRLNREIELDKTRTWCPRAGCETICLIGPTEHDQKVSPFDVATPTAIITNASETATINSENKFNSSQNENLCNVLCPTCREEFCSSCKKPWHPNLTCEEYSNKLAAEGQDDGIGIPFDNDLIKCCPMCAVPIEKDEGCAQMMCKRCKHVFCWYCLASLDDDFLLRHYDKGPCKNKLGHSRASVVWHRAQVIGIFAGFGILLLVASPLLLLAAPCIICCKCRICNSSTKLDDPDADFDDGVALQSGTTFNGTTPRQKRHCLQSGPDGKLKFKKVLSRWL